MKTKAAFKISLAFFLGMAAWMFSLEAGLGIALADPGTLDSKNPALFDAFLYFADSGRTHLKAVPKTFPAGLDDHTLGKAVLTALMAGPPDGMGRVFPDATRINALFIKDRNEAYVDIGIDQGQLPSSDTITEYLGVYSLVNTLTVNIPRIKQVKILINGTDKGSLGGHLSLDNFFKTNMLIVK
ncbi:MAG: GerMN domain-containing protein [Desulfobacter sp.]|nr:GerMN domain-containing protein [Desulfobacter sp.]WDP85364.1 MAG: GerMN domain-containing protein [Desulfobacter sp.]